MSEISPEWVMRETTTIDLVKNHAGSILVSREVARVAEFLEAWYDAMDAD